MNKIFSPKFFTLLKAGFTKKQIATDVMAGVVVGIVALPLAIAFAVASGVSPEKGLVTGIVAGFIIALLGGSRVQIGGPTGAFIIIVFGIVQQYGINGLMISTIMAGVILIAFGLLKLGTLLKYIPQPLVVGFTSGIAIVIFSTQIKDALGLDIEKVPAGFIDKWTVFLTNLDSTNLYAVAITAVTILLALYSRKVVSKVPGSFIAIIIMTVLVQALELPVSTIETFFGEIPNEISFVMPTFQISDLAIYIVPAITIALLGSIESLLSAVVGDGMIGGKHRSNTELIAQGVANIVTPFFGGIPATGAIARTATNIKTGGRTPIAGMIHALTLLVIMLFFGQWAKMIPMSCLAGILIVVAYNMSEWRTFVSILKTSYFDIIILVVTFLLTVLVDLTVAIQVGVVLSALLFMKRMTDIAEKKINNIVDSDIIEDYSDIPEGITIYEISGPLFFGTAKTYTRIIETIGLKHKIIVIRMRHVSFVDQTAIHNFEDTVKTLTKSGVRIILSGVNADVGKSFENSGIMAKIGKENVFELFNDAVNYAKKNIVLS